MKSVEGKRSSPMRMSSLEQYRTVEALEQYLGDPADASNVFSFERSVGLDELELYPEAACDLLERWNFSDYYIPAAYGGRLESFEEFVALLRVVARRDLTVAIAHGKTYLGAVAGWVGGSLEQRQRLARLIKEGHQVALGLTERGHGSDLLSSEVQATPIPGGYALSGEKWLINNATRSRALTIFARTDERGGPRGFSLFLVEKDDDSSFTHLPKIKTHGIRGADISGISFQRHTVADDSIIGSPGAGLEVILKSFQLTRTAIAGLSLGAADTALRTAMDFAVARKLYGDTVFAIPHARRLLTDAFLDLLTCDCLTTGIVRAAHVATQQMSLWSAIAKYFVPTTVETLVNNLSTVLGARHYLRDDFRSGIFQKIVRDNAILSLFDGSTVVNLNAIALQLKQLASDRVKPGAHGDESLRARLEQIYTLTHPLPELNPDNLTLSNRKPDLILQGLETSLSRMSAPEMEGDVDAEVLRHVQHLTRALIEEVRRLHQTVRDFNGPCDYASDKFPELFEQAERYCVLHAAASCVHLWTHSRERLEEFYRGGEWVVLALARQLKKLRGVSERVPAEYYERAAEQLERLHAERKSFALVPLQLGTQPCG